MGYIVHFTNVSWVVVANVTQSRSSVLLLWLPTSTLYTDLKQWFTFLLFKYPVTCHSIRNYYFLGQTCNLFKKLIISVRRFGVACTYYGITLNVTGFGVNIYLTQFIYGAIELPAKALVFFTLNTIGRRLSQAGTLFLTGLCIVCNMFIPQGE